MNSQDEVKYEEFELEVSCPKCGSHKFSNDKMPKGGWMKTVYWCLSGRGVKPCMGRACFCKKCNKIYPETMFGKHGNVYECKECGTVQWEYTERKEYEEQENAFMRNFKMNFPF